MVTFNNPYPMVFLDHMQIQNRVGWWKITLKNITPLTELQVMNGGPRSDRSYTPVSNKEAVDLFLKHEAYPLNYPKLVEDSDFRTPEQRKADREIREYEEELKREREQKIQQEKEIQEAKALKRKLHPNLWQRLLRLLSKNGV